MAVALVPATAPGVKVRPFWNSFVLAGAESDEVELCDVEVPRDLVVLTDVTPDQQLDDLQTSGFVWFELLVTASYLGVVSSLVERALRVTKADAAVRAGLVIETDAAMSTLEGVALAMTDGPDGPGQRGEEMFAKVLFARYAVQDTIGRVARQAVEVLGGMSYIGSSEVAYLSAATAALLFHPPSRGRMADSICDYVAGEPLRVV
jgi:alkylation response protein AidB-like acyl-CoA dehydrogenase